MTENYAMRLLYKGYIDTQFDFSNFFNNDHTIMACPIVGETGSGVYAFGQGDYREGNGGYKQRRRNTILLLPTYRIRKGQLKLQLGRGWIS